MLYVFTGKCEPTSHSWQDSQAGCKSQWQVKVTKIKKWRGRCWSRPTFDASFPPRPFVLPAFLPASPTLLFPALSPWSGGRQRVSARTRRSLWEPSWLAGLRSTVHNRLRHGELPLTAFLRRSCGFDTVTPTPTLPLTLQLPSPLFHSPSFHFQSHLPPAPPPTPRPPRNSHSVAALKAILNRHHCGPPLSFLSLFSLFLLWSRCEPLSRLCSPCTVILNFTQFSVLGVRAKREQKERWKWETCFTANHAGSCQT